MLRSRWLILLCLSTFLICGSCTYLRQLVGVVAEKPEVRLLEVDIRSLSPRRMELDFVLEVFNPNSFSVDLEKLAYNVQSLELALGEGSSDELIHIPSKEKTVVRLPFRMAPEVLVELMKKYLKNPREMKVKFRAHFFLGTALGKMDMRFEEEKTIMKGLSSF